MKVNTNGITNSALTPKPPVPSTQAGSQPPIGGLPPDANAYTPSSELLTLLDQVKKQPDIRADRVSAVMERLRQGFYTSPESAVQTAEAKFNSLD